MSDAATPGPGFFGKVRTHGDFVSRRLPVDFLTPWDRSLQEGMLFAQRQFGAQWLPVYLNAPVWCFAVGAQVCGASAWAGVLMPGVDRVGRYFPFTIAASLERVDAAKWIGSAQAWYDAITRLALSTLAADFVLERFDAELGALELDDGGPEAMPWRLETADASAVSSPTFAELLVTCMTPGSSGWWSEGSVAVPASLRIGRGLPDAPRFTALLDAAAPGWQTAIPLIAR